MGKRRVKSPPPVRIEDLIMKSGDLVKPRLPHGDSRVIGFLTEKHKFFPDCWYVCWKYDRPTSRVGVGVAYEESLKVVNASG